MGEISEMMLNGSLCERCGAYIDGDEPGYPRYCSDACRADRGYTPAKLPPIQSRAKKKRSKKTTRGHPQQDWGYTMAAIAEFAAHNGLSMTPRNPNHPTYELARLQGHGVSLMVYAHTTKTTGNKHARIRNDNSQNAARARHLIITSGFAYKESSLP